MLQQLVVQVLQRLQKGWPRAILCDVDCNLFEAPT